MNESELAIHDEAGASPVERQAFNWRVYLDKTDSTTPPLEAFYHNCAEVPQNNFQLDQLILVPDKNSYVMVLAKVICVYKCWIQYQILGLRDKNLVWVMCDDSTLQPIEPLDAASDRVTRGAFPVTGFQCNNFRKWIGKLYEQNEDKIAAAEEFAPLSNSFQPTEVHFEVGMKMAVLHQNSFAGKLLVATVGGVDSNNNLRLLFDGYDHMDFTVLPWNSRDLFPFEYAEKIGEVLEAPPKAKITPNKRMRSMRARSEGFEQQGNRAVMMKDDLLTNERPREDTRMRWSQKAVVMRERSSGVTEKVADILKKARIELAVEEGKKAKQEPRVVAVQKTILLPGTSSQSAHYSIVPLLQPTQMLQPPNVFRAVRVSQQVRLVPARISYQPRPLNLPVSGIHKQLVPTMTQGGNAMAVAHPSGLVVPVLPLQPGTGKRAASELPSTSMSSPAEPPLGPDGDASLEPEVDRDSNSPSTLESLASSPLTPEVPLPVEESERVQFVYSHECTSGPLLIKKRLNTLRRHPSLQYRIALRRVIYDLFYCLQDPRVLFNAFDSTGKSEPHINIFCEYENSSVNKLVAIPDGKARCIRWLKQHLISLGACGNLVSTAEEGRCRRCAGPDESHAEQRSRRGGGLRPSAVSERKPIVLDEEDEEVDEVDMEETDDEVDEADGDVYQANNDVDGSELQAEETSDDEEERPYRMPFEQAEQTAVIGGRIFTLRQLCRTVGIKPTGAAIVAGPVDRSKVRARYFYEPSTGRWYKKVDNRLEAHEPEDEEAEQSEEEE